MDERKIILVLVFLALFVTAYAFRDSTIIQEITSFSWDSITGKPFIPTEATIDANIVELDTNIFKNAPSDCPANQYVYGFNSDGTIDCRIDIGGAGGGTGTTYTGVAPIAVDNDNNTIGLNVDGHDWNGTLDGLEGNDISTRSDADGNYINIYNCDNNANCTLTGDITGAIGYQIDTNVTTECAAGEFLTGGGFCENISGNIFLPHHVLLSVGTFVSGDVNSMRILNEGDGYAVSEAVGSPAIIIDLNYINVTEFNEIVLHTFYDATGGHEIDVEMYNFSTGIYDTFGEIPKAGDFITTQISVISSTNYVNADGNANLRFTHATAGTPAHDLNVDYAVLQFMFGGLIVTDHGALSGQGDNDHLQYLLRTDQNNFSSLDVNAFEKCSDGEIWIMSGAGWDCGTIINGAITHPNVLPWADVNVSDDITASNYLRRDDDINYLQISNWGDINTTINIFFGNYFDGNWLLNWLFSFDGNFSERFQTDFDSNIAATELSEIIYDADFNAAFPAGTGQRMITQDEWDANFLIWWGHSFDSNFTVSFDGNIIIIYSDLRTDIDNNVANLYNCDSNATCTFTGDITGAIGFETDSNYITEGHTDNLSSWVYDSDFNAAIATLSTGQRMITQQEWDANFLIQWDLSFDGNFSTKFDDYFDGNWLTNWNLSFDENWNVRFQKDFDGNFNIRFQADFDSNIAATNLSMLIYDADFNAAFPTGGGGADGSCDNNASCTLLASTIDDWNGTSSLASGVIASPPWLTIAPDSSCDNNVDCTIIGDITGAVGFETDSNAATECSGASSFLSGEAICQDTNSFYPTLHTNENIFGLWTFLQIPLLPSSSPTNDNEAARKKYVDDIAAGLSWRAPVIDKNRSTPPVAPSTGDRHIVAPDGQGAWAGHDNNIMDYNGSDWISEGDLVVGWAIFTTIDSKGFTWSGTDQNWIQFSGGTAYSAGDGIDIEGTTIAVDIKSGDGLRIDGIELTIDYANIDLSQLGYDVDHNAVWSKIEDTNNPSRLLYTTITGEPWITGESLASYIAGGGIQIGDNNEIIYNDTNANAADVNRTGNSNFVNVSISGDLIPIEDMVSWIGRATARFMGYFYDLIVGNDLTVLGQANIEDANIVNVVEDINFISGVDANFNQGNIFLIDSNICGGIPLNDGSDRLILHLNESVAGANGEAATIAGNINVYHFDKGTGTIATDEGGSSNDLTLINTPTWTVDGKYGSALDFDAGSNEYAEIADNIDHDPENEDFSWGLWVKPETAVPAAVKYLMNKTTIFGNAWILQQHTDGTVSGAIFQDLSNFNSAQSSQTLTNGVWTFLVVTWDTTTEELLLYWDGDLETTGSLTGTVGTVDSAGATTIAALTGGIANTHFDGIIDEAFILKGTKLTADEVFMLYNFQWKGRTYISPAKMDSGYYAFRGNSLRFSTIDNIQKTGTISGWAYINWDGDDGLTHSFFEMQVASTSNRLRFYKAADNKLKIRIHDSTTATKESFVVVDSTNFAKNTWHYIVATYDNGTLKLYLNGEAVGTEAGAGSGKLLQKPALMYFGRASSLQVGETLAILDEFVIRNRALTAEEIYCEYLSGRNGHQAVLGE